MLALTLEQATRFAMVAALVLVALAVVSAWLMKTVTQKVALAVVLGALAVLVWTQRTSLQDCADRVRSDAGASQAGASQLDTTCSFLGRDVTIPTRRDR